MQLKAPSIDRTRKLARCAGTLLLALGLACASPPPPEPAKQAPPAPPPSAPANAGPSVLSLKAPEAFGIYSLSERKDSGNASDGIAHSYTSTTGEHWTATFYARDDLGADPEQALDAQLEVFRSVLEYQRAQRIFDSYEIIAAGQDLIRGSGGAVIQGRKLGYVYRKGKTAFVSVLFIYAVRDGYVKIRGTIDSETWKLAQPPFPRDFMKALVALNNPV
jgi:hypothetical protein